MVATPDGVWHRDSHYRSQLIWGGTEDAEFYKGKMEDVLQCFVDVSLIFLVFACFSMGFGIGILITGANL